MGAAAWRGRAATYGPSEQVLLFDNAWDEAAQRWLSALGRRALDAPRRRERADSLSVRYHDAVHLDFDGASAIYKRLRIGRLLQRGYGCTEARLVRAYWNMQTFLDMNEPHQDADAIDPAAESVTALLYPHDTWHDEWAGHTVFLTPALDDVLYAAAPLPRRLLLFSATIPHFGAKASSGARPFGSAAASEENAQWADAHARVSLAFKLSCMRDDAASTAAMPRPGACGIDCSSGRMGEATSYHITADGGGGWSPREHVVEDDADDTDTLDHAEATGVPPEAAAAALPSAPEADLEQVLGTQQPVRSPVILRAAVDAERLHAWRIGSLRALPESEEYAVRLQERVGSPEFTHHSESGAWPSWATHRRAPCPSAPRSPPPRRPKSNRARHPRCRRRSGVTPTSAP